ncbi:MAG: Flp pilus assembly protein CpaB [Gemmataceae bacterium]
MKRTVVKVLALVALGLLRHSATADEETTKVLVAKGDLAQWTPVRDPAAMFEEKEVPKRQVPPTYIPPAAIGETRDRPLIKNLKKGQVLTWEDLQDKNKAGLEALLPAGKRAFTIKITPAAAVGGFALPGSHVDLIHVVKKGEDYQATCIMEDVLIRAVDLLPVRPDDRPALLPETVTFEVTPEEALKLARYAEFGTIRLALRPFGDKKRNFKEP